MKKYYIVLALIFILISCSNTKKIARNNQKIEQKKVLELDLSGKGLDVIPFDVGQYQDLEELNLSNNNFSEFPIEILKLSNLQLLNLKGNNLSIIPDEIIELSKLKTLNLMDNTFKTLPNSIQSLHDLRMLILIDNPISVEAYDSLKCLVNDSCTILIANEFLEKPPYNCSDTLK